MLITSIDAVEWRCDNAAVQAHQVINRGTNRAARWHAHNIIVNDVKCRQEEEADCQERGVYMHA